LEPQEHPQNVNDVAKFYVDTEGWAVLPAAPGEKEAKIPGWPQLIIGVDAVDEYFPPGEDLNIVRVNGENSGGAGDLDLDRDEARRVAPHILPSGLRRFGREGENLGHVDVRFADTVPRTSKFVLPGDGDDRMVVELRANGSQTLLPPSFYPNGDRCVWEDGEVLEAHAVTLRGYAEDIAIAATALMNYPGEGARQEFMMGLVGLLVKSKHPAERVRRIVDAVTRCARDPERQQRLDLVDQTVTKHMMGQRVAGKKQLAKFAPEMPQLVREWLQVGSIMDSGLPQIMTTNAPLREVSDKATDALLDANEPPEIFARTGNLARIAQDDEGRPVIQDIDGPRLRYRMTRTAEYLKETKKGIEHCFPPEAVVADVRAAKAFSFPTLTGITQSPVLRASGTVLTKPGYDKESGLIYIPEEDVKISVPETPTRKHVEAAAELLYEVYCDFPFIDEASLANMLALTMTPILRPAYTGPTPLAVIDKPTPGTGASLLTEVVCQIATAREAAMMSPPEGEEETRKVITSVLMTGRPIIVVDNLGSELKNPAWARVLTSTTWEDRILGHTRVATLPQRATWITNGNNVRIGGDLPRRCYWIRLDAKLEKPWDRKPEDFTHPDLLDWVSEERGELLGAILTLARNWFATGKPKWSGRPPGSFEGWARMVGGILQSAGIPGFLGNADKMFETVVEGQGEWLEFLSLWVDAFGPDTGVPSKKVVEFLRSPKGERMRDALPSELATPFAAEDPLLTRKFGEAFSRKEDVRHGSEQLRIYRKGTVNGNMTWAVGRGSSTPDGPRGPRGRSEDAVASGEGAEDARVGRVTHPGPNSAGLMQKQQIITNNYNQGTIALTQPEEGQGESPDPPHPPPDSNVVQMFPAGNHVYNYVTGDPALKACAEDIRSSVGALGVDLETTSLNWWEGKIRLVSVTTVAGTIWVVDAFKVDPEPLYRVLEERECIFHNAVFDVPYLRAAGCFPKVSRCTKILDRLRWAGAHGREHGIVNTANQYLPADKAKEVKADGVDHEVWKESSLPRHAIDYAAADTRHLLEIYDAEREVLVHTGLNKVAEIEERFLQAVIEVTATGMPVNPEKWSEVVDEAERRKGELFGELDELFRSEVPEVEIPEKFTKANKIGKNASLTEEINWCSPPQKIWAVEAMGLTVPTTWSPKKKEERKTLGKDQLHELDHPVAELLRELQGIQNFPTTFRKAIENRFLDGWLYADWNQLEACTGRMSCQNPPMQGLPRKSALREAIVAPAGYVLATFDFSQIEPRTLASLTRDKDLIAAFQNGEDIYKWAASKATDIPVEKVGDELRKIFKIVVLGLSYGMTEFGLGRNMRRDVDQNITNEDAGAYRDAFFEAFEGIKEYHQQCQSEMDSGKSRVESRTLTGRRRLNIENVRQLLNAPIQGSAADVFKLAVAMVLERRASPEDFKMVALIHDELVLLIKEDRVEETEEFVKATMAEAAGTIINEKLPKSLHIPIEVDSGYGSTLQAAKDAAA